ncbi:DUF4242 domain-containing protein [Nonomuraea sp. LPB2021202275-12-8]|uniref:DUF4242 domain-containing protein n=1 Tax=Nonomuraea sp. LPB2021202275-12-8 TaxID=3120159 RepID=UPI00300D340D
MPLYLIERHFAEQVDPTDDKLSLIAEINLEEKVTWLFSFLAADRLLMYCLYEAPSAEAIKTAARRADLPADAVREVSRETADTLRQAARIGAG